MTSIHQRPFSSITSLYLPQQNLSQNNMSSPVSPTPSSFSVPSPFSSASSNSFPNENSPISESFFDGTPSPIDAINSDVAVYPLGPAQIQMFTSQGDLAAPYASEFDYGMIALSSDLKKPQVPSLQPVPPSQLFNSPPHNQHQTPPRPLDAALTKTMHAVYIPPPVPPQRHSQAASQSAVRSLSLSSSIRSACQQQHQQQTQSSHLIAQQSLAPPPVTANVGNDVMFDVDLDDWNASHANMHPHGHPSTYPAATLDSQPTSRPKQDELLFSGGMAVYPAATASTHVEVQNQFYDMTSIMPSQSADPAASLSQARTSPRHSQYQHQHQHQSSPAFYSSSQFPQSQLPFHQQYVTVRPTEVSSLDSCPSNSPSAAYPDIASAGVGVLVADGCDPGGYMPVTVASNEDLKDTSGIDLGLGLTLGSSALQPDWNGERKILDADLGDLDAEGEEEDFSGLMEHQSFRTLSNAHLTMATNNNPEDGEDDEASFDDTDGSKLSEDSSTDSDDSEFVPGSMQRRRRRRLQPAMSSSYPLYTFPEGRSLRTRSGTRYTPYPNGYSTDNGTDYMDQQSFDQSSPASITKRFAGASASPTPDFLAFADANSHLQFTTLSSATSSPSRRRPRPSNSLPVPVPVPNLTKKSRGRRVPTVTSLEDLRSASSGAGKKRQSAGKGARMYLCEVDGCGKCFARGEHLKRHVRSIHTYEKPHRCPYPGCGKDFSRHDNLGQHMRVHKDFVCPESKA